jgi:hypothetical protein
MQTLAWRDLTRFVRNSLRVLTPEQSAANPSGLHAPRLTFRVGVAGPLDLGAQGAAIETVAGGVLSAIRKTCNDLAGDYRDCFRRPPTHAEPCLRLVTSLAAGADQLFAEAALKSQYSLDVVLPAPREVFRQTTDAAAQDFDRLVKESNRVFELDGDLGEELTEAQRNRAYAAAAKVLLANSDLLIVVVGKNSQPQRGGTIWLFRRAIRAQIPIVVIPLEDPRRAELRWPRGGEFACESFDPTRPEEEVSCYFRKVLEPMLVLPKEQRPTASHKGRGGHSASAPLPDSQRFERAYRAGHDEAEKRRQWKKTWNCDAAGCPPKGIAAAKSAICAAFEDAIVWGDHRSTVYGELYRGAFIASVLLGAGAVSFALLNVLVHGWSTIPKLLEVFLLSVVIVMYLRARHYGWKERWLNYRRLERHLNAAAWLALLGRTIRLSAPAHIWHFYDRASWANWYTQCVLRSAPLLNVRVDRDYLNAVRDLALTGLVRDQLEYYRNQVVTHRHTEERLERAGRRLVIWALLVTTAYLILHLLHHQHWFAAIPGYGKLRDVVFPALAAAGIEAPGEAISDFGRRLAIVFGAGLPAWAGALAAIRSNGEHNQISLRYGGQAVALSRIEREFGLLADDPGPKQPLRAAALGWNSRDLARLLQRTTGILTQEVEHWHSLLFTKEIEPT